MSQGAVSQKNRLSSFWKPYLMGICTVKLPGTCALSHPFLNTCHLGGTGHSGNRSLVDSLILCWPHQWTYSLLASMQFLHNNFVCLTATGAEDVCMCATGCLNCVCKCLCCSYLFWQWQEGQLRLYECECSWVWVIGSWLTVSYPISKKPAREGAFYLTLCKYLEDGLLVSYVVCYNISLVMIEIVLSAFGITTLMIWCLIVFFGRASFRQSGL